MHGEVLGRRGKGKGEGLILEANFGGGGWSPMVLARWCWWLVLLSFADSPGEKVWRRGVPLILENLIGKGGEELV